MNQCHRGIIKFTFAAYFHLHLALGSVRSPPPTAAGLRFERWPVPGTSRGMDRVVLRDSPAPPSSIQLDQFESVAAPRVEGMSEREGCFAAVPIRSSSLFVPMSNVQCAMCNAKKAGQWSLNASRPRRESSPFLTCPPLRPCRLGILAPLCSCDIQTRSPWHTGPFTPT